MNKIKLEDIKHILENKGKTQIFSKNYRYFQAGKTDLENHQELLFLTEAE